MKRTRLTLALLLAATPAVAAPPPAARPAPGPAGEPSACVPGRSGAIARVACALAAELGGVPAGALVVAAPLVSDVPAPDPGRLTARVAGVVAGALGHGARSADEAASLARGRSLASAAGSLVFLQVTLARGELRVVADLFPVPRGFWERVRDPEPSPRAHAFASERLDAELRALLPPVPLVASRVDRASSPEKSPLALACGDLDGDGALELVITGRVAVHVGRIRNRAFVGSAVSRWSELSAVAPSPLRAPIGGLAIEPGRYLEVGITDRAEALRLDSTLRPLQKLGRELPWPAAGCIRVAGVALSSAPTPCRSGDGASARVELGEPLDAVAGAWVSRPDGSARRVLAGRIAGKPIALLVDDEGRRARVEGAGAELAVGDLDGDGAPELLAGTDTLDPASDALVAWTWREDGTVIERLRLAVKSGVHAIAVCPPDGPGLAPVAVATGDGVWVVR